MNWQTMRAMKLDEDSLKLVADKLWKSHQYGTLHHLGLTCRSMHRHIKPLLDVSKNSVELLRALKEYTMAPRGTGRYFRNEQEAAKYKEAVRLHESRRQTVRKVLYRYQFSKRLSVHEGSHARQFYLKGWQQPDEARNMQSLQLFAKDLARMATICPPLQFVFICRRMTPQQVQAVENCGINVQYHGGGDDRYVYSLQRGKNL